MADDKRTLYKVSNDNAGPRGLWSEGQLSYVDAGQAVLATLTDSEKSTADATGYFTIAKPSTDDKAALAPDASPVS